MLEDHIETEERLRHYSRLIISSAYLLWLQRFTHHDARGRYDKAIVDFDMAIEIKPNFSRAITERNKALEQQERAATGQ